MSVDLAASAAGASLESLVQSALNSKPGRAFQVNQSTLLNLGRNATAREINNYGRLLNRGGIFAVWQSEASSAQFYVGAGKTTSGFLRELDQTFLGGSPSWDEDQAESDLNPDLARSVSWRVQAIDQLFSEQDFRQDVVGNLEENFAGGLESLPDSVLAQQAVALGQPRGFTSVLAQDLTNPAEVDSLLNKPVFLGAPLTASPGASSVPLSASGTPSNAQATTAPASAAGLVNNDPHFGDSIDFLQPSSDQEANAFKFNRNPFPTLGLDDWAQVVTGTNGTSTGNLLNPESFTQFTQEIWFNTTSTGVNIVALAAVQNQGQADEADYVFPEIYVDSSGMLDAGLFAGGTTQGELEQAPGVSRTTDSNGKTLVTYALPNYTLNTQMYVADGQWHNVTLVGGDNNTSLQIYVDGIWAGGSNTANDVNGNPITGQSWRMLPQGLDTASTQVWSVLGGGISAQTVSGAAQQIQSGFVGRMDEYRVWNQALSSSWIGAHAADAPGAVESDWPSFVQSQDLASSGASDPSDLNAMWYTFDSGAYLSPAQPDQTLDFQYTGADGSWTNLYEPMFPDPQSTQTISYDSLDGIPRARFATQAPMLDVALPSSIPTAIAYSTDTIPYPAPASIPATQTETREVYLDQGEGLLLYLERSTDFAANASYEVQVIESNPASWFDPSSGRDVPTSVVQDQTTSFYTGAIGQGANAPVVVTAGSAGYYQIVITRTIDGPLPAIAQAVAVQVQVMPGPYGSDVLAMLTGQVVSSGYQPGSDGLDWSDQTAAGLNRFYQEYPGADPQILADAYAALSNQMPPAYQDFVIPTVTAGDASSIRAWIDTYNGDLSDAYGTLDDEWSAPSSGKSDEDVAALAAVDANLMWLNQARTNVTIYLNNLVTSSILNQFSVTASATRVKTKIESFALAAEGPGRGATVVPLRFHGRFGPETGGPRGIEGVYRVRPRRRGFGLDRMGRPVEPPFRQAFYVHRSGHAERDPGGDRAVAILQQESFGYHERLGQRGGPNQDDPGGRGERLRDAPGLRQPCAGQPGGRALGPDRGRAERAGRGECRRLGGLEQGAARHVRVDPDQGRAPPVPVRFLILRVLGRHQRGFAIRHCIGIAAQSCRTRRSGRQPGLSPAGGQRQGVSLDTLWIQLLLEGWRCCAGL